MKNKFKIKPMLNELYDLNMFTEGEHEYKADNVISLNPCTLESMIDHLSNKNKINKIIVESGPSTNFR